jgi:hypothetical protein
MRYTGLSDFAMATCGRLASAAAVAVNAFTPRVVPPFCEVRNP